MYDIEASSTDSADRIGEELSGMLTTEEQARFMGECDVADEHCSKNAFSAPTEEKPTKPAETETKKEEKVEEKPAKVESLPQKEAPKP